MIKINKERSIGFEIKVIDNMISRQIIPLNKKYLFHISPIQARLMAYIHQNKDKEVYQKDLEELFNMRRSTISGILRNMEKNNLIKRINSPKDARIKQIILTESSKNIGNTMKRQREMYEKKLKQNISKEDLEIFYKVIDQIKENISN